jgi:hypothetical protein
MRIHDLAFATRPVSHTARALLGGGSLRLVFAPYGDGWMDERSLSAVQPPTRPERPKRGHIGPIDLSAAREPIRTCRLFAN